MDVDARAIRECTRIQGSDAFPRIVDRGTPRPKVKFSTLPSPLREICGALKSSFGRLLLPTFYRHRFFPFVLPLRVAHQLLNSSSLRVPSSFSRSFSLRFSFLSLSRSLVEPAALRSLFLLRSVVVYVSRCRRSFVARDRRSQEEIDSSISSKQPRPRNTPQSRNYIFRHCQIIANTVQ